MRTSEIRRLVETGKKHGGTLTVDDLNETIARNTMTPERLDALLATLRGHDVDVVVDTVPTAGARDRSVSDARAAGADAREPFGKTNDPVRMYLRRMGEVPLLTREGEVEIAKRIEEGENEVFDLVMSTEVGIQTILDLEDAIRRNQVALKTIVKDLDDDDDLAEEGEGTRERILRQIDQVKELDRAIHKIRQRLAKPNTSSMMRRNLEAELARKEKELRQVLIDMGLHRNLIQEIVKKLKGLVKKIDAANRDIARVKSQIGGEITDLRRMLRESRRAGGAQVIAPSGVPLDLDALEEYDRIVKYAQKRIRRVEHEVNLSAEELKQLRAAIRAAERKAEKAKCELVEANL